MLFEVSKRVLEAIRDMAEQEAAANGIAIGKRKSLGKFDTATPATKVLCPNCKRPVIGEQLIEKGCYLCGFTLPDCGKDRKPKAKVREANRDVKE